MSGAASVIASQRRCRLVKRKTGWEVHDVSVNFGTKVS